MPQATNLNVFNYTIKNQSEEALDIYIDGAIVDANTQQIYKEWFGDTTSISYRSFRDEVLNSKANIFNVYINSPGGIVTDALAIHDLLVDLQAKGKTVNTEGRGLVASSATYILMAGKNPTMSTNCWMMIHNVSAGGWGSVDEIERLARTMRQFNDKAVKFYQQRTKLPEGDVAQMMQEETWMTAEQAKEKGFISSISGEVEITNQIRPEDWMFNNTTILNLYNQQSKKHFDMDINKITQAIKDSLKEFFTQQPGGVKPENQASTDTAIENLTDKLVNSFKESNRTDEEINVLITNAINGAGFIKKDDITQLIADGTKDVVTNEAMQTALTGIETKITNSVVAALGGGEIENTGGGTQPAGGKKKISNLKNRFSSYANESDAWMVN